MKSNFGIYGLGVMGENLAMNLERNGFIVSLYNKYEGVVDKFINNRGKGLKFIGANDLKEFVDSIETPRKILIMIKAGSPVDEVIESLIPLLSKGDILIDGGNSNYNDSIRRCEYLESKNLRFLGMGVSGGEEGALNGPSLMPGGSKDSYELVRPILEKISAKVDNEPCVAYMSSTGSGHYVKMVHNGIEYGDMELICESYDIMRKILNLKANEMSEIFSFWNETELESYLIDITSKILSHKEDDGSFTVDKILDCAGQKGTGKWASIEALNEGMSLSLITEAVYQRCISSLKEERVAASKILEKGTIGTSVKTVALLESLERALYASKIISYAQGFSLLKQAASTYNWDYDYSSIAKIWRGGCIIRSAFLNKISNVFIKNKDIANIMIDDYFSDELKKSIYDLRYIVSIASLSGVPVPAFSSALSYYDSYRSESLPLNLLQAQRDYFGAHTYERIDKKRGEIFHTNWTGKGGDTTSTNYKA